MKRTNLILAVVLAALLGLVFLYRGPVKRWQAASGQPKNFLAEIDLDRLDKVEIGEPVRLTLKKEEQGWQVASAKPSAAASPALIEEMLGQLKSAQANRLELVSTRAERKAEFQTDQSGLLVALYQGERRLLLLVGKPTSDYAGAYLSRPDDDATYRPAKADLASIFQNEEWRDPAIFKGGEADRITKLRLQFPSGQYFLEKKGAEWHHGTAKLDKAKVGKIAERLADLTAVKIPAQDFGPTGLDRSRLIIQGTGEGIDRTLMLGQADSAGFVYAKRGDSDLIYLIDQADWEELSRLPDQLK